MSRRNPTVLVQKREENVYIYNSQWKIVKIKDTSDKSVGFPLEIFSRIVHKFREKDIFQVLFSIKALYQLQSARIKVKILYFFINYEIK